MDYLLKASAILLIFYLCYQLFLQRETFFQANRWFLLSGLILASCIPLIVIPVYIEYTASGSSGFIYDINTVANNNLNTVETQPFDYTQLIIWTYLGGILLFFGKLCVEFLSLRKIIKTSKPIATNDLKIMETTESVAPFSFFNRIVYNPNQFKNEELTHVINHEKVHTKELHSIDTIIAQLACILFWFNPVVWLYKKALQQNLEFIADQKAQYISHCEKSYQTVLLKASVKNHELAFTNNFYTSLIKKRIIMLHKSKSNKLNQLKFIVVLPLLALFMMSFNTKDIYVEIPSEVHIDPITLEVPQTGDVEIVITKDTTDDELKTIQDKLKSKGITFNYNKVKRNSKGEITSIQTDFKNDNHSSNYSINGDDGIKAFKFKSSDDVFSVGTINKGNAFTYVTSDGKTVKGQSTGSNVYVFESEDEHEDSDYDQNNEEHKAKIVYKTKTWTDKNGEKISINASENGNKNIVIRETSDEPLFIIDGKVVKKSTFEDVDSDKIQSINVLKGITAKEAYGDKGQNGVVIMTKKGSKSYFINSNQGKTKVVSKFSFEADGKQPLYIIDGKVIDVQEFNGLEPDNIMSIDIIKDEKALEVYGKKGKDGVIVIRSKDGLTAKGQNKQIIIEEQRSPTIIEVRESPRKIDTKVSGWVYEDYDSDATTAVLVISKTSTNEFLDQQKKALKEHGIDAKFNKVRRNKAGEITGIKITLNDNQGRKSSSSWKEKNQAIPDIIMGKSKDDKLFIRAIGH